MAVPKYIKAQEGRPLKYKTIESLQEAINNYFEKVKSDFASVDKLPVYTMSGLALALGLDRKSLINYQNRDEFFPTIKEARARVEESVETLMISGQGSAPGCIFSMKNNFDWKDTQYLAGDKDNPLQVSLVDAIKEARDRIAQDVAES